jgi:hypothetical protein
MSLSLIIRYQSPDESGLENRGAGQKKGENADAAASPRTTNLVSWLFLTDFEVDFTGSNLTQSCHYQAVILGIDQGGIPLVKLLDPLGSQHNQEEAVIDFFQTIFNGYPCHNLVLLPAVNKWSAVNTLFYFKYQTISPPVPAS